MGEKKTAINVVTGHGMNQKLILWDFPLYIAYAIPGFLVVLLLSFSIASKRCGRYWKGEIYFLIYRHIHPKNSYTNFLLSDFIKLAELKILWFPFTQGKGNNSPLREILAKWKWWHLTSSDLVVIHWRSMLKSLLPGLQCSPKNAIYPESWHLDELQSRHMGTGVSSSHQAKNQPLSPVSRLALGGDGFLTITSIHEGRALGSTLNNPSLSWSKQGNSCRVFPVMLLILKCCSPGGAHGGRHRNPTLRRLWPIFMITWLLLH